MQQGMTGSGPPTVLGASHGAMWLFKPPGVTVFPSRAAPGSPCLLDALYAERPDQARLPWPEGFEGGILHRLDTATSGLIAAATDLASFEAFRARFAGRGLLKRYLLLAPPGPGGAELRVDLDLAHHRSDKRRMVPRQGPRSRHRGKWYPARTRFWRRSEGDACLWEVEMETGVMHQIRAHAAAAGIPLLGDALYGGAPIDGPAPGAAFYLHHLQMEWRGGCSPRAPLPEGWPSWTGLQVSPER